MYLRMTEDQQVFLNLSLSSPSGSDLLVTSVPKRSIEGPRAKVFRECPKTSIFFCVFVVFFFIFDHLTIYRVEGGQFPLDITYFQCVSESSDSFPLLSRRAGKFSMLQGLTTDTWY